MQEEIGKIVDILLIEDSDEDAELTIRSLKKYALRNNIVRLKNGEEALDYLFKKTDKGEFNKIPKLVLLDLKMPKVDGLEVLKQIRSNERTKYIPVVMLTSSREEKDVVESYQYGVNSYIVKPVDFKAFIEAISDVGKYWLVLNEKP